MKSKSVLTKLQRLSSVANDSTRRVVSTSQWPVPYYNRIQKAYPVRESKTLDLSSPVFEMNDQVFLQAKELMEQNPELSRVLNSVKSNMQSDTYCLEMKDIGNQAKSYVIELSHFIDVA